MNNLPSKKVFSFLILTVALVASIILAFGKDKGSQAINFTENLIAGEKMVIPENPNWQKELGGISTNLKLDETTKENTSDKTVTDDVSISLISNYLAMKQSGTLTQESAQKLLDQTLDYIDKTGTPMTEISRLNVIADNGKQTLIDYGENLGTILRNNRPKVIKNELEIITQAVKTRDQSKINELDEIITIYEKIASDLLKMPVPKTFVKAHLDIINGIKGMALSLKEIKIVLNDPFKSLHGVQIYQESLTKLTEALQASVFFINYNKIVYKQESGGYYLLYGL